MCFLRVTKTQVGGGSVFFFFFEKKMYKNDNKKVKNIKRETVDRVRGRAEPERGGAECAMI